MGLNLYELAIATGYGYSMVRRWRKEGLPLLDGKITRRDAIEWRKSQVPKKPALPLIQKEAIPPPPSIAGHPLLPGRFRGRSSQL